MEGLVEWPNDAHLSHVWGKLDKMVTGQILVIRDHTKFKDLFIQCTKMYINCFKSAEFNSDYTIIKKINTFQQETKKGHTFPVMRDKVI